ncbi:MAG: hypothetical protein HZB85_10420 [Deltaproteobacteria bacterium]|nr:hypothetical protein [Deltaproteobacteria bacterium]
MTYSRTFATALFFLVLLASAPVFAGAAPISVDAEGTAIKSSAYDVRKKATEASLKQAVTLAVGTVTSREGMKAADPAALAYINSNAAAYVTTYKILSEGWMTHFDVTQQAVEEALGADKGGQQAIPPPLSIEEQSLGVEVYHIRINATLDAAGLYAALVNFSGASPARQAGIYTLALVDMADYNVYNTAMAALLASPEIKDINYGSFYRGRITLTAASFLAGRTLAERLVRELGAGFVIGMDGERGILIKQAPAGVIPNEAQ